MTDPRWTIEGSVLMWWAQGDERGPSLHQRDLGAIWDALPYDDVNDAFDALVAAVRDAELLRQIRVEFDSYEDLVGDPYDMSRFVGFLGEILLAPVSGTPTPTHDREPQPGDGPDYYADHRAWVERQGRAGRTDFIAASTPGDTQAEEPT